MTSAVTNEVLPTTLPEVFSKTVIKYAPKLAFRQIEAKPVQGNVDLSANFEQISTTWAEYAHSVTAFGKALIREGVNAKEAVTIQGANSRHWLIANVGTIVAGGVSAGVYPTNNYELSQHAVTRSGAKVVVVEDEKQLAKYQGLKATAVKCFVVWNKAREQKSKVEVSAPVYAWDEFLERGRDIPDERLTERMKGQKSDDVCTLIFTSGTTGLPKACALTHDNLLYTARVTGERFAFEARHHGLSYLPLSHIAAQQLDCIVPIVFGSSIDIAPADALKGNNLRTHLVSCRPTYFLAVPRVWEKFKEAIQAKVQTATPFRKRLFTLATALGGRLVRDIQQIESLGAGPLSLIDRVKSIVEPFFLKVLDRMIFSPIKKALGLDRCEIAASGAGKLSEQVVDFFAGLNIRIIDLFGMSELSGPATIGGGPLGSSGKVLPGTEIKIALPDDRGEGEICLKGRNVMKGYLYEPQATNEAIDIEGFLRTGDKGRLDSDGNLFITGRIKEQFKTSGGENIAPVRIEENLQKALPVLSQSVVLGEQRNFLTCLLTLKTKAGFPGLLEDSVVAEFAKIGAKCTTVDQALTDPLVKKHIQDGLNEVNKSADSRDKEVKKFTLLADDFTVENGLMTPTQKLRRSEIFKKYKTQIDRMYSQEATA